MAGMIEFSRLEAVTPGIWPSDVSKLTILAPKSRSEASKILKPLVYARGARHVESKMNYFSDPRSEVLPKMHSLSIDVKSSDKKHTQLVSVVPKSPRPQNRPQVLFTTRGSSPKVTLSRPDSTGLRMRPAPNYSRIFSY